MIRLSDNTRYNKEEGKWVKWQPEKKDVSIPKNPTPFSLSDKLLNYFSIPVKELRDGEGGAILVYPQTFSDTVDETGGQAVFDITKRDAKGEPVEFWARNLVGFISYEGKEVTISSRFSGRGNDNFLYYMLARVAGINLLDLDFSSQNKDKELNLMIFLFSKLLKEALGQGLFKQYIYREYNDGNVRGPIDINRHIRRNIPFNGRVAYRTRELSYDNPVTQLVRHAIEWIKISPWGQAILNSDEITRSFIQEIVAATPTYEARLRQEVINQNLRPATHPYYTSWQPLQEFCLRLLRYESLSYGADKKNKIHGLLIDAAWLWEEYIGRVLAEKGTGLAHYTRSSSYHLLETSTGKKFQQVIPDYYDEERKLVADAKYIPLHRYDHLDAERAAAVYYKTVMYMYRFDTNVGFLFHPCSQEDANNVKTNEELSHVKVEDDTITTIYQIEGREDCWLHEVGMVIPQIENDKNFSNFKEDMRKVEESFVLSLKAI